MPALNALLFGIARCIFAKGDLEMAKRFLLFVGIFTYVFFLLELAVFALSLNMVPYNVGSQPESVLVGDFDRDGILDSEICRLVSVGLIKSCVFILPLSFAIITLGF